MFVCMGGLYCIQPYTEYDVALLSVSPAYLCKQRLISYLFDLKAVQRETT